jgi:hypothetical protein
MAKMRHELRLAYEAGRALPSVNWDTGQEGSPPVTDEHRRMGVHHCPFALDSDEGKAWCEGLRDAIGGNPTDRATLLKQLDDVLPVKSNAR